MKKIILIGLVFFFNISFSYCQVWKQYTINDGLINNTVKCIAADSSGNLWIGAFGGISKFNGTIFTNYSTLQGLPGNNVKTIICDYSGTLWIGTQTGLSKTIGSGFTNYYVANGLPSNSISSLAPASGGTLWIGTTSSGISKYDGTTFTNYNTTNGLISNSTTSLCIDLTGKIWIGTSSGISVFDGTTFSNYNTTNGLPGNNIRTIFCDVSGNIWIGTSAGLTKYDGTSFVTLTTVEGLLNNSVLSIKGDNSGNMWIGYLSEGISKFNGTTFTNFNQNNGFIWANISSFQQLNNNIYAATNSGLLEFRKWTSPPLRFAYLDTNNIAAGINACGVLFESSDGFRPEFHVPKNTGFTSIFASSIWMGGFDQNNLLHIAAQRFIGYSPNDFWAGPLYSDLNTYADDSTWNRLWKISKSEIDNHILNYTQPGYIIPNSISEWPAPTADYVDANGNNIYDPNNGDYPLMRGDQAILTIYNDIANPHGLGGLPLGFEVHSLSYSFNSNDSALANTVFNNYKIYNYSSNDYNDFYLGVYSDIDIGDPNDDYIGCDSTVSLFYAYNANLTDAQYGSHTPAQGVVLLSSNMYSFNYYSNSSGIMGDPYTYLEHYNVLNGYWKDGTPYTYGGNGYGGTTYTNYCFSGDPNNPLGWSEVTEGFPSGDRRGVGTVGPFTLLAGKTLCIDVAYPNAISYTGNNLNSVSVLKERTSQIIQFYNAQSWDCGEIFTDTNTVAHLYSVDTTICRGTSYNFNNILVGGTPPYTYSWSPATGLSNPNILNPSVTPLQTTQYILTVTDHQNHITIDTVLITVYSPFVYAGSDTTICNNNFLTLTANSGLSNYHWDCCGWSQSVNVNTGHNSTGTVNYIVTGYDWSGCTNKDTIAVTYLPSPDVHLGSNDILCQNETLILNTNTTADHFLWNTGANTNSIILNGSTYTPGIYSFNAHAWNNNGCNSYDTILITTSDPNVSAGNDQTICSNEMITLTATPGFSLYQWSCCGNSQSITVNTNHDYIGTYNFIVTVTNNLNCTDQDTVSVTFMPAPDVNLYNDTILCNTETILLNAGSGANNYLWNTGATTSTLFVDGTTLSLGLHQFNVHAWNDNGCHSYDTINVNVQICSGFSELSKNGFIVYPNPSEGIFYIESNQPYSLKITDLKGDIVFVKQITQIKEKIILTDLSKGIYVLDILSDQKSLKTKLVLY